MSPEVLEQEWQRLLAMLPSDLEASARDTGALVRPREIRSGADLLHLAFVYAVTNLSLRSTAEWAREAGVADFTDVAVLKRLRNAAGFLARLLTQKLAERTQLPALEAAAAPLTPPAMGEAGAASQASLGRVRLLDATVVCRPGATGTDFRIHLGLDLATLCIDHLELTDASGGETLSRLPMAPGDLVVADRGDSHRRGIAAVVAAQADLIVRLNWHNLPLQDPTGKPFAILSALRPLAAGEVAEFAVQTAPDPKAELPAVGGRLIAIAKSQQEAETARRAIRKQARKKGKTPSAGTLEAAGYVFVFTTLPAERLAARSALELYRFRWQIELAFKRLKGLLTLGQLAAKDPQLCRTTLLTRLLGALLVDELTHGAVAAVAFSPWEQRSPPPRCGNGRTRTPALALAAPARGRRHAAPGDRCRPDPGAVATPRWRTGLRPAGGVASAAQSGWPGAPSPCLLPISLSLS